MRIKSASTFKFSVGSVMAGLATVGLGLLGSIHASFASPEFLSSAKPTQLLTQASAVVSSGQFVAGEKPTKGMAKIVNQGGKKVLQLDQAFSTSSMGPDLVVILHKSKNPIASAKAPFSLKSGDYVVLAPLQKFQGAQSYAIPENVSLANYKSVGIWCRKFNATFGYAALQ